ncbi:hypothetical protein Hypma_012214 [Hypsizygus marmoreus]|uniref:Uncharacterized protein n=1 Tax=Hypsizygus marmoreus TaxID=39966 RepID=A0A369JM57_HYPMA|nr:hypothetical protein Hypma_012214 [Hypsizygus marmoreus]
MSNPPSSSNTVAQPSSSPAPAPNDARISIAGIVLGILVFIVIGGIIFATIRMKRRRAANAKAGADYYVSSSHGTTLDRDHPAARITPFGAPGGETPRFIVLIVSEHTPGSDMRIAIRRPDGAWHFADPRTPFTPSGVSEIDVLPSPSSSSSIKFPRRVHAKEYETKLSRELHMGYDDIEANPPPPAYHYDYGGYIHHAKS